MKNSNAPRVKRGVIRAVAFDYGASILLVGTVFTVLDCLTELH